MPGEDVFLEMDFEDRVSGMDVHDHVTHPDLDDSFWAPEVEEDRPEEDIFEERDGGPECEGHESLYGSEAGMTVHCDGACKDGF